MGESYGKEYLPARPVIYRGKKAAQDAHEAIRPTLAWRRPEEVKAALDRDQNLSALRADLEAIRGFSDEPSAI